MTLALIRLNVSDLRRARSFYCEALGFTVAENATPRLLRLALGAQVIELVETQGRPYPSGSTSADLWFQHFAIVTTDIAEAHARVMCYETAAITQGGPQLLPPAAGAVRAFKFRDPDGHPLELLQFAGATARWPARADRLTIGIDHTAISVSDSERSIAFYQNLGLVLVARQTNTGPAQERLDGLSDVAVEVIAMARPGAPPPHLELLCYRMPRGRTLEAQSNPQDIVDTKTVLQASVREEELRDPDGHLIRLVAGSARIS
jgi:catechol 2,3-dioxygenase-like lactoylglutathione lyase family enzyme